MVVDINRVSGGYRAGNTPVIPVSHHFPVKGVWFYGQKELVSGTDVLVR